MDKNTFDDVVATLRAVAASLNGIAGEKVADAHWNRIIDRTIAEVNTAVKDIVKAGPDDKSIRRLVEGVRFALAAFPVLVQGLGTQLRADVSNGRATEEQAAARTEQARRLGGVGLAQLELVERLLKRI
jgi:hypothetical protein